MRQIIDERGAGAELGDVPGGSTGLLTETYVGKEANPPVDKLDTGLLPAHLRWSWKGTHRRQSPRTSKPTL
jgi:hypothetical protein